MTHPVELVAHARELVAGHLARPGGTSGDVALRRALSSAYHGLFHQLTTAGSMPFAAGGEPLRFQAARAFSHTAMRKVCDAYVRWPTRPFPAALQHLNPGAPDKRLAAVAYASAQLQEGRHAADYDLSTAISAQYAAGLVRLAETALADFDAVQSLPETTVFLSLPETTVFLAALLLADRWTRRG